MSSAQRTSVPVVAGFASVFLLIVRTLYAARYKNSSFFDFDTFDDGVLFALDVSAVLVALLAICWRRNMFGEFDAIGWRGIAVVVLLVVVVPAVT